MSTLPTETVVFGGRARAVEAGRALSVDGAVEPAIRVSGGFSDAGSTIAP